MSGEFTTRIRRRIADIHGLGGAGVDVAPVRVDDDLSLEAWVGHLEGTDLPGAAGDQLPAVTWLLGGREDLAPDGPPAGELMGCILCCDTDRSACQQADDDRGGMGVLIVFTGVSSGGLMARSSGRGESGVIVGFLGGVNRRVPRPPSGRHR